MATRPIRPEEITSIKRTAIPDAVIEAFNCLIAETWDGSRARIRQADAVKAIRARLPDVPVGEIFKGRWLDIEDVFRDAGWEVEYDKPGFNESYEASFTFRKPRGKAGD